MDVCVSYENQINDSEANISLPDWSLSVKYYEDKEYLKSLRHILLYLNGKLSIPESGAFSIKIPHGSVVVEIKADNEKFSVLAPFIKVPNDTNGLPILRQVLELNFSYLVLSKIVENNGDLFFQFEDKIENCEPYKVYSILEEICYGADYYDDVFIDKYKADFVQKPALKYFSDSEVAEARKTFKSIIEETVTYCNYLESKRYYGSACDVLAIGFTKLDYVLAPQGILGTDLNNAFNDMYKDDSAQNIASKTKAKLQKFLEYDNAKFKESMFTPNFFVPFKKRAELPLIHDFFKNTFENASGTISTGATLAASLSMIFAMYDISYRYRIPYEVSEILSKALSQASKQPWDKAAKILYDGLKKVMAMDKLTKLEPVSKNTASKKTDSSQKSSSFTSSSIVKSVVGKVTKLFKMFS